MTIDQNGTPSVVTAESTVSGKVIGDKLVTPVPPRATMGSIASDLLGLFDGAAVIVIDPNTRSVWGASGDAGVAIGSAAAADPGVSSDIAPDSGQTGKSLTWSAMTNPAMPASVKAVISAAIDAAKPKRTISSLVSSLLTGEFEGKAPTLMIDQVNGVVRLSNPTTAGSMTTTLDALANAGDRVKITLSESETAASAEKFVFEGGAV